MWRVNKRIVVWLRRNHDDVYHVLVPFVLAILISAGSLSGSTAFLCAWGVIRELVRASRDV